MELGGAFKASAVWGTALLLAVYMAGFSFRQVIGAGVCIGIWSLGSDVWKRAYSQPPFRRIQFRFMISYLGKAYLDAGIYTSDELQIVMNPIMESLPGKGWIFLTWLEPSLYFINTGQSFSSDPEFSFSLKTFRNGVEVSPIESLPDQLVFRVTEEGYELVLISAEQRMNNEWPRPNRLSGTVLFKIPVGALWALQGKDGTYKGHENARNLMAEKSNLHYRRIEEVRDGWDYENEFGSFRWWYV